MCPILCFWALRLRNEGLVLSPIEYGLLCRLTWNSKNHDLVRWCSVGNDLPGVESEPFEDVIQENYQLDFFLGVIPILLPCISNRSQAYRPPCNRWFGLAVFGVERVPGSCRYMSKTPSQPPNHRFGPNRTWGSPPFTGSMLQLSISGDFRGLRLSVPELRSLLKRRDVDIAGATETKISETGERDSRQGGIFL